MAYMFRLPSSPTPEDMESAPPPPIPQKSPKRSRPPAIGFGSASLQGGSLDPPPYTTVIYAEVAKSDRKSSYIQDGRCMRFVGRGASRRAYAIAAIMLILTIALAVGLAIGIRKRHRANANSSSKPQSSPTPSSAASPGQNYTLPAGSFSVETFLDTIDTGCVSNAATWRCYPYTIYNTDPVAAAATFDWIISPAPPGSKTPFTVSSTNNPFAPKFANVAMELVAPGTNEERYTFQLQMNKTVIPDQPITDDNSQAICHFQTVTFQASLYSKMQKTYPQKPTSTASASPSTASSSDPAVPKPWPFAVRVEEVGSSGDGVPACYKTQNGVQGDSILLKTGGTGGLCSCLYRNWRN
ncbi:MAG: hypothetical protein M1840_000398 [Geoglossum simile]|nr:MAG: hypothetical protein M1840_000398 [Geoglossum simile]